VRDAERDLHIRGAYGLQPDHRRRLVLGVEALMAFGPRAIAELLLEVADGEVDELLGRLNEYARLGRTVDRLDGANWTAPIRAAIRGRRAAHVAGSDGAVEEMARLSHRSAGAGRGYASSCAPIAASPATS
jgi:hypothetical protein